MPAARHASRGDEKRGDHAAVSPLLLIVVETGKRGDLNPRLAHGERALLLGFHLRKVLRGAVVRGTMTPQCATRAEANGRTLGDRPPRAPAPGGRGHRRDGDDGRAVQGARRPRRRHAALDRSRADAAPGGPLA